MPPLVMPWRLRNPSSVRASTSKIALPMPRTSYLAAAIKNIPFASVAAYHVRPRASKPWPLWNALMIRPILTVSAGTLTSRLLGFARDAMVAALLGAGPVADAFLVAVQGISVLRRSVTEGALNTALVPAYLRVRDNDGATAAAAFAGRVLGSVSLVMAVAAALIGVAMPLVITALAPGFAGHATLNLAVDSARLMLPYLAFAGPVAVMMGLLNAQHRFALAAFSPILFNLALIAAMTMLLTWRQNATDAALAMAATV